MNSIRETATMRESLKVVVTVEAWSGNRRPYIGRVSWIALDGTERARRTGYCATPSGAKRLAEQLANAVVAESLATLSA